MSLRGGYEPDEAVYTKPKRLLLRQLADRNDINLAMKLFYDHLLIDLHPVYAEIEHLEIDVKDKRELIKIVDETTHHTVLDVILQHLPHKHHESFLEKLHTSPHDQKHWLLLKKEITDIDSKIIQAITKLSAQLHAAILTAALGHKSNKAKL